MIASLRGQVLEKLGSQAVLDVNGVGYGVEVTIEDNSNIVIGKFAKLYIYEHIRETSHDLYGFTRLAVSQLFTKLLGVTGVGPKMALSILNAGNLNDVIKAIASGDVKFLQAANGVGKRVAERLVVDLKDKVGLAAGTDATAFLNSPSSEDEAVQALVALGLPIQDAELALVNIDDKLPLEDRVKKALQAR